MGSGGATRGIPPNGFGKSAADIDDLELGAALGLVAEGDGVGNDDAGQAAPVDGFDGVSAENAVWKAR